MTENPGTIFPFVASTHPFGPILAELRAEIARRPWRGPRGTTSSIHAEIKALPRGDGSWKLDRFYWSRQWPDPAAPGGLAAETLNYSAHSASHEWLCFPSDPYLAHMQDYFAPASGGTPARVLRYVPLRRTTFYTAGPDGQPRIGKFKRRSRFREAYALLRQVHDAVTRARVSFAVARPVAIDEAHCLYFQSALAGSNVADVITRATAPAELAAIGTIHGELARLPAAGLPVRNNSTWLTQARTSLDLITLYRPEAGRRLAPTVARLADAVPTDRPVDFCHGDFVCSQLLRSDRNWAITDFDLCHGGDRHRDAAMFLAALAYDVPALAQDEAAIAQAEEGYLAGYAASPAGALDRRRLAWHRACAELYFMALGFKKDRHDESDFARRARVICALASPRELPA